MSNHMDNEKTAAGATNTGDGKEQITRSNSADYSTLTATKAKRRRKRPPLRHLIVNMKDIEAGTSTTYRALCGYTFPIRFGIPQDSAPAGEVARWEHCKACSEMERHSADLVRYLARDERARRLAQFLLDYREEKSL